MRQQTKKSLIRLSPKRCHHHKLIKSPSNQGGSVRNLPRFIHLQVLNVQAQTWQTKKGCKKCLLCWKVCCQMSWNAANGKLTDSNCKSCHQLTSLILSLFTFYSLCLCSNKYAQGQSTFPLDVSIVLCSDLAKILIFCQFWLL